MKRGFFSTNFIRFHGSPSPAILKERRCYTGGVFSYIRPPANNSPAPLAIHFSDFGFMIACVQDDVEIWLQQVCTQVEFQGAQLEYRSGIDAEKFSRLSKIPRHRVAAKKRLKERTKTIAWESVIQSGKEELGKLQIRVDDSQSLPPTFFEVCHLADTLTRMASDYSELKRVFRLNQEKHTLENNLEPKDEISFLVKNSLESGIKLTGYRGAAFFLLNEQGEELHLKHYCHQQLAVLPEPVRPIRSASYDLDALLGSPAVCRSEKQKRSSWLPENVSTGVCFQVATSHGAVGTLWFYDRRARKIEDRDYHVLQSIAAQLGTILDRLVLSNQSANHRRMKTELRLASVTQPAKTIHHHCDEKKIDCYGRCLSQYDVGGDLCELIPLENHLVVVIGDASGNSIPAAMVMTAARGAVYALLAERNQDENPPEDGDTTLPIEPARFMETLNKMLVQLTGAYQFMSCVCGVLDLKKMSFTFSNAGHPPPIHLSNAPVQYLPSHGLLLGIDSESEYTQDTLDLSPEDLLVLYTDGISEAMNQGTRQLFRQDGIATSAELAREQNAQGVVSAIWDRMIAHSIGSDESDDATALVIKFSK